ncbi:MAG TPA: hypothetical protein DD435_10375 [Cyanobacteria bacterium UBA8530]|nr:hypothetical protein [Cyanobacteria bacterium UBA8530]
MKQDHQVFGILVIYASEAWAFRQEEVRLLSLLAENVSFGIIAIRNRHERDQALALLKKSEARLQSAFDSAAVGMAITALDGCYLKVNRSLSEILGYSEAELLSKNFQEFTYPDDLSSDLGPWEQLVAGRLDSYRIEKRYRHKDGRIIWGHLTAGLVRDEQGSPGFGIRILDDITARKQAEGESQARAKELAHERDFAKKLIDNAPFGISYLNRDLVVAWVNPAKARILRTSAEAVIGRHVFDVFGPDSKSQIGPTLNKVLKTGQPQFKKSVPLLLIFEGKEQMTYWDFSYQPLFDENGKLDGILHLCIEVTDRIENERLQREQFETLRQADRYKDEFLSVISHELRTPLNAVMGFGSLLEDEAAGPLNPKQRDFVTKMLKGADRMLVLIDDLLDFARMQTGKFGISVVGTDYASLIEETLGSFQSSADAKKLRLESEVYVPMPVCVDRRRVQQVIANLIANALKFTPEGGWVRVKACVIDDQLVTEVSDNGIGIPSEDLKKIFEPFKQLDMGVTRRTGGVGLGLSISKAIIEAHKGTFEVESEIGKGSTFIFKLPIVFANP